MDDVLGIGFRLEGFMNPSASSRLRLLLPVAADRCFDYAPYQAIDCAGIGEPGATMQ